MTPELLALLKARKRLDIDPPNLAPSCALVRTSQGHLSELIYWLAPNQDEDSPFACEHVALLSVVDGVVVAADFSDENQYAFAPESEVTLIKTQDETRFMRRERERLKAEFFGKNLPRKS